MTTNKLKLNPDKTEFLLISHERQRLKYLSMFPVTLLESETRPSKTAKILVLCLMRILISELTSTMFANFPTITSATCAESENICTWTKPSAAWRLPLCPVGLTTATPCWMVSQLGTWSNSRECRDVLPGWSPELVALHLAPPPPSSLSPLVTHFLQNSVQNTHLNLQDPLFW